MPLARGPWPASATGVALVALVVGCGASPERVKAFRPDDPGVAAGTPPEAPVAASAPSASASSTAAPSTSTVWELPKSGEFPRPPRATPTPGDTGEVVVMLAVDVARDGSLSLDGARVASLDDLSVIARTRFEKDPSIRAVIRADRNVAYGSVVEALDALKRAGIQKIALGVVAP